MLPRKTVDVDETSRTLVDRLLGAGVVTRALAWREQHKRFEPASFFFGGVMWDAATLQRIDKVVDKVILSTYLVVLGA